MMYADKDKHNNHPLPFPLQVTGGEWERGGAGLSRGRGMSGCGGETGFDRL